MLCKKWIFFLFGLLYFGIPFEYKRIHILRPFARSMLHKFEKCASFPLTVPPFFEKHVHFYLSDLLILCIAALVIWSMRVRLKEFFFGGQSRYLSLFFCIAFLSLIFSPFARYTIQYIQLIHFGFILLAFHAARLFFQDHKSLIPVIFWIIAIASAFECCLGLWQFFSQGPAGLHFLGEIPLHIEGDHLAVIPLTPASRKFIEFFTAFPEGHTYLLRASGTFLHPNIFAAYLTASSILSLFLFVQTKKRFANAFLILLIFVQIFTLLLTFSRAGLIAWVLAASAFFGTMLSKRIDLASGEKTRLKFLMFFLMGGLLTSFIALLPFLLARGGVLNYTALSQNSDQIRIGYQQIAFKMIKAHPLFGMGFNCSVIAPSEFFPEFRGWIHNIYLLIGSETGLIGLGCFLLFLFSLIRSFAKGPLTLMSAALFAIVIGFMFIGLCDFYFLIVQSGKLMFFLFTGLLAASARQKRIISLSC